MTSLYARNIQQETEAIQRSLVSGHNLAFGQEDIFTLNLVALADWNNIVQNKIFSCIKAYGTPQQQNAMGVCLAANIDLLDFVKKVAQLKDKSKNIQRDLAGETQVIMAMTKTLETLEQTIASQKPQTYTQQLIYHLIVTLQTTLKRALKELVEL